MTYSRGCPYLKLAPPDMSISGDTAPSAISVSQEMMQKIGKKIKNYPWFSYSTWIASVIARAPGWRQMSQTCISTASVAVSPKQISQQELLDNPKKIYL